VKLYLPNGAFTFASRQAYRLAYRSQREAPHDRALRRAFKLRGKLGADGGRGDYVPKPKWMRWPTYDRKLEEIFDAEEVVDACREPFWRGLIGSRCMLRVACAPRDTGGAGLVRCVRRNKHSGWRHGV
jgi:hypothetical protein